MTKRYTYAFSFLDKDKKEEIQKIINILKNKTGLRKDILLCDIIKEYYKNWQK
mgnify:CR=1 FL=1